MRRLGTPQEVPMPDDVRALSQKPGTKLGHSTAKHPVMVEGRRDCFTYRDLAVKDASGGRMRAQLTKAKTGMTEPTGWHYHVCEHQFVYVLNGWVELEFERREMLRCGPGGNDYLPGRRRDNKRATRDDFQ